MHTHIDKLMIYSCVVINQGSWLQVTETQLELAEEIERKVLIHEIRGKVE